MDKALRFELNKISEFNNKIFPANAPENQKSPYLVYIKSNYKQLKTLEGLKNDTDVSYLLNILSGSYEQLQELTKKVRKQLLTFPLSRIGEENIFIQDMTINNIAETYESELKLYRSIIDIDFSYKEA